jgi:predicted DsbA family dithiol-disulfide isomerase
VLIEIWSDIVCPWCYLGVARFSTALAGFEPRDAVTVRHRSFELDPAAPIAVSSVVDMLVTKFGSSRDEVLALEERMAGLARAEGLPYTADRPTGNSLDAHRVLHLARAAGREDDVRDALWRAHFGAGASLFDPPSLTAAAVDAGLAPDAVAALLAGEQYRADVRADEARAGELGITGVPFFVIGGTATGRALGISGAQATDVFGRALAQAWSGS